MDYFLFRFKFGSGRAIQSGDVLETAEDRAAKEKCTRNLLADGR